MNCSICCYLEYNSNINKRISDISNLLTVGRVVASHCNFYAPFRVATMNVRYFNHVFVNIDIAPLIVTNAVLSTLCKSLPMNRDPECFHECFLDVVSCQVTFWSMTSLDATHVTLYLALRVQNFVFQTMLILTEVTGLKSRVCSTPFLRQTMSKTKMATNRRHWSISFFRENAAQFQRTSRL